MRLLIRLVFWLVFAAGVVLAIVYPQTMRNAEGDEIGRWIGEPAQDGSYVARPTVSPDDAPFAITVELRTAGPLRSAEGRRVLELSVVDDSGQNVLDTVLGFPAAASLESPQTRVNVYRERAGGLDDFEGQSQFVLTPSNGYEDVALSTEIILNHAGYRLDPNARPVGIAMMVIGLLGHFLTRRRREHPNAQPPPPRWGR